MQGAFDGYTEAALAQDGEAAAALLASPVFDFYEEARQSALTGTEAEVGEQTVSQQLTVYLLRAEVEPAVLRNGSVTELLEAAVDKGLVGEQGIRELTLSDIQVDGDEASAAVMVRGQTAPFRFMFLREEGTWKVDIEPLLSIGDEAFRQQAEQQGVSTDELIQALLVEKYGQQEADALREPVDG